MYYTVYIINDHAIKYLKVFGLASQVAPTSKDMHSLKYSSMTVIEGSTLLTYQAWREPSRSASPNGKAVAHLSFTNSPCLSQGTRSLTSDCSPSPLFAATRQCIPRVPYCPHRNWSWHLGPGLAQWVTYE